MSKRLSQLYQTIKKKPATAPDGLTDDEASSQGEKIKDTSVIHDLVHLKGKDKLMLAHALKDMASGEPMDDRKLMLEHGVSMLQSLPPNSGLSHAISDGFIGMLWNDLPHPPSSTLEPRSIYHSADGSGNNIWNPDMGKAGSAYARSVPPLQPKSPFLPDPELVFDQLLRRREFREHKAGLNRLFFSFATVVIHEIFQSKHGEPWINQTSSYVDLSTLYGNNQEEQNRIRKFEHGLIFPDTIASDRIMMMPPGVVAVVLIMSRHHNYLAEKLMLVNEKGKYKPWDQLSEEQKKWQDNDLFQLARNINVAFFAKVVLTDYVSAILNTVREDSDWHLELGKEIKQAGGKRLERGTGNVASCEFNISYHWHAALSAADEKWMEDTIKHAYPDKDPVDITAMEFMMMAKKHKAVLDATSPSQWTFGGLKRKANGYFDDVQLAELIKDAVEEPANAFGARGTPACMKVIDVLGQLQARGTFNVCTMNEFRRYLNLKEFSSFAEWNPDPEIAHAAEKLYGHIDQLELYPGLLAEEAKPNMPGSGVQPGHTIGRGILDDAVALVRGDRFLTHDLNSTTLTSWGVSQLKPHPGAYGGFLGVLLFRALPYAWGQGFSTYNLLPFYTPKAIRQILSTNKKLERYHLQRPRSDVQFQGIHSFAACKAAFHDRDTFRVPYEPNIQLATNGHAFFLAFDDHARHDPGKEYMHEAFFGPNFETNVRSFFTAKSEEAIKSSSLAFDRPSKRRQLNVVRDVFNRVPILWIADHYAIPLKTPTTPHGLISPVDLGLVLTALFIHSSFDVIPHASFVLREAAEKFAPVIRSILTLRMKSNYGVREKVHDAFAKGGSYEVSEAADHLYHTIIKKKIPVESAVGSILGSMIPIAGNQTQQASLLLDLFLSEGYEYAKDRLIELSTTKELDDKEANDEFEMWVWEGMRHAGVVPGLPRLVAQDIDIDDGPGREKLHLRAGDKVLIATSKCHMDPSQFPNPERLDPTRKKTSYMLLGSGMHFCFGARLVAPSIVSMLRAVFRLKNVRRAPGAPGHFKKLHEDLGHLHDAARIYLYLDIHSREGPVPTTLMIEYDDDE